MICGRSTNTWRTFLTCRCCAMAPAAGWAEWMIACLQRGWPAGRSRPRLGDRGKLPQRLKGSWHPTLCKCAKDGALGFLVARHGAEMAHLIHAAGLPWGARRQRGGRASNWLPARRREESDFRMPAWRDPKAEYRRAFT